jgi:hypothetical protein
MPNTHAKKQDNEEKLHGDPLQATTSGTPTKQKEQEEQRQQPKSSHAIPAPDDGGHARSQAAHLGGHLHDHTKPVGDLRHYEQEREPPMEVSRAGKDYRRQ